MVLTMVIVTVIVLLDPMICYNHHGSKPSIFGLEDPPNAGGIVYECIVVSWGALGNHKKTIEKFRGSPPVGHPSPPKKSFRK